MLKPLLKGARRSASTRFVVGFTTLFVVGFMTLFLIGQQQQQQLETVNDELSITGHDGGGDWKGKSVAEMSDEEVRQYLHWPNSSACYVTNDFGGQIVRFKGRVAIDGQKTVCMDDAVVPRPGKCLVYSFGINNEWSFDELMEEYGCQVYAFDPSMKLNDHDHSPGVHFMRLGLGAADTNHGANGWKMRTLSSIHKMLSKRHGDVPIDYLKVDIEGDEWTVLPQMLRSGILDKVRQMGFELHHGKGDAPEPDLVRRRLAVVQQLEDAGMVRFALRPNVFWKGPLFGVEDHHLYELAWYNRRLRRSDA